MSVSPDRRPNENFSCVIFFTSASWVGRKHCRTSTAIRTQNRDYGRGAGVGRGLGVGEHLPLQGVADGVGVAVGDGVAVAVADGVGVGVGVPDGLIIR